MFDQLEGSVRHVDGLAAISRAWVRNALVAAATCCASGVVVSVASADWSSTSSVGQSAICPQSLLGETGSNANVAFGPRNIAWVACARSKGTGGLVVGRLTRQYRLTTVQEIPGTGSSVVSAPTLAINSDGIAVLAWLFHRPEAPGMPGPPAEGVAAMTWRVGQHPGSPIILASELHGFWRLPSVAINSKGIAVVLLALQRVHLKPNPSSAELGEEVVAARLQDDRLLGVQQLAYTAGLLGSGAPAGSLDGSPGTLDHVELESTKTRGFRAAWQIIDGPYPASHHPQITAGSGGAGPSGVFGNLTATTVTPQESEFGFATEAGVLRSNVIGDQAATWEAGLLSGFRDPSLKALLNIYVSSRRPGRPFGVPQLVGTSAYDFDPPRTVIDPAGNITVMWLGKSNQVLVARGKAGRRLSTPRRVAIHVHPRGFSGLQLIVTQHNGILASWLEPAGKMYAVASRDGTHFSRPHLLSTASQCSNPTVTPDISAGALVAWECSPPNKAERIDQFARFRS